VEKVEKIDESELNDKSLYFSSFSTSPSISLEITILPLSTPLIPCPGVMPSPISSSTPPSRLCSFLSNRLYSLSCLSALLSSKPLHFLCSVPFVVHYFENKFLIPI
jgi:small neutral amino acid transporter SnatA (MarC family)